MVFNADLSQANGGLSVGLFSNFPCLYSLCVGLRWCVVERKVDNGLHEKYSSSKLVSLSPDIFPPLISSLLTQHSLTHTHTHTHTRMHARTHATHTHKHGKHTVNHDIICNIRVRKAREQGPPLWRHSWWRHSLAPCSKLTVYIYVRILGETILKMTFRKNAFRPKIWPYSGWINTLTNSQNTNKL